MRSGNRAGAVIFTGDRDRLVAFYQAVTGLPLEVSDASISVLANEHFELVIHVLPGEPAGNAAAAREDTYVKPFFPVASLAAAREKAHSLGGHLQPANEEWKGRGFTACEGVDPDGNVIQVREQIPNELRT